MASTILLGFISTSTFMSPLSSSGFFCLLSHPRGSISVSWTTAPGSTMPVLFCSHSTLASREIFWNIHKVCSHQTWGSNPSSYCVSFLERTFSARPPCHNGKWEYAEDSFQRSMGIHIRLKGLPNKCELSLTLECIYSLVCCHLVPNEYPIGPF